MKKILIGIGTILIMAFVVILFVNANGSRKESQKAKTESCCPASQTEAKTVNSDCGQTGSCTGTCGSKTTGAK